MLVALKRITKYGFLSFLRNGFVSLATILVMTIALFMISASIFSDAALKSVLKSLENQVDINVYFTPEADGEAINKLAKELEALAESESVTLKSKEEVLAEFKNRHKNDELTIKSLEELGENPFGATIAVRAKSPEDYAKIAKFLEGKIEALNKEKQIIEKVNFTDSKKAIDTLNSIIKSSKKITAVVLAFLILVAVLIVFNTIRLAVFTNKEEIAIMKLVGASDAYVQGPFIVEGALYGIVSAILTMLIVWPLSVYIDPSAKAFLGSFSTYEYFKTHAVNLFAVLLTVGVLLGVASSYLSVKRYLDV